MNYFKGFKFSGASVFGFLLSLTATFAGNESQKALHSIPVQTTWLKVPVIGGPIKGELQLAITDYGAGMKINSWEIANPPDWFNGFHAAKGMNYMTYDQYKHAVSEDFLKSMMLADEQKFKSMHGGAMSGSAPNYSVFKVVYLKCEAGEYAFVSHWNDQGESLESTTKRIETDGKTKYLGSWMPLRKDVGRFVLIGGNNELIENGLYYVSCEDPERLRLLAAGKTLVWDEVQKKYNIP